MMAPAAQHEPPVQRFRKPSWRDPRLLIGLLLVLTSIAAVVLVVAGLNRTEPYYVAARDLSVGQRVTAEDVVAADVRLQDAASHYVPADRRITVETVVTQRVPRGQLIPSSVLGTADDLERSPVGIPLETPVPADAGPGSHVDVWVAAQKASGRGYETPRKLMPGAEIARIDASTSALGSGSGTTVHVLATPAQIAPLVDALGNDAKVTLVPHPAGARS